MKYLNLKNPIQLTVGLPDGDVLLTARHVPAQDAAAYDTEKEQIDKRYENKEIVFEEYMFQILEHLCQDFDRSKFVDVSVWGLRDITAELNRLVLESRRAEEKKSG